MPRLRLAARTVTVVLALLAIALPAVAAGGSDTLPKRLARALVVPQISRANTGATAIELSSGKVVFALNAQRALIPASNEKLAVTYAALVRLGPSYRIETDVVSTGALDGATWRGNLILRGHGDPTLSRAGLAALARQVRAAGVRRVEGLVIGDESYFDQRRGVAGWKSWYYGNECPPLSALSVDRGRLSGTLARRPALGAAILFRRALRKAGIAAPGRAAEGRAAQTAAPVASVLGPPLATIVRFMDRESDNYTAEMLLKQLGAVAAKRGTSAAGAEVIRRALAEGGVPLAGVRIVDGSGLSSLDRLTPRALVAILHAAWSNPAIRKSFAGALAVAGVNGTLEDRLRAAPTRGNVLGKTGTTDVSSALSGFVRDRYAFAVVQNGHPIASWWARQAQDRFVRALAAAPVRR